MRLSPLLLAAALLSTSAFASDLGKERRWAEQIVDALIDGEAVWLDAGGQEFLGIYTAADPADSRYGAIILHGIGIHPDWPQVIYPLRTRLPARGWHTLSLQMPVLPNDAPARDYLPLLDEVAPRIDAGLAYLKGRGIDRVVIIGHSLGATMAEHYLSSGPRAVRGFVALGMSGEIRHGAVENANRLSRIELPILDLHGSADTPQVLAAAARRKLAAAAQPRAAYRSETIAGANHFYDGREDALIGVIVDWLAAHFQAAD